ncbi:MAG: hypothetical protein RLZZ56_630, partial [Actinomycetota bacterium]
MFGTPFCAHEFTGEQLDNFDKVTCPCGNQFESNNLREFNRLRFLIADSTKQLNKTVQAMASFNSYAREARATAEAAAVVAPVVPKIEKPKKIKPKRERPKLSVTQWLIVTAGFMVLVAASVFVSQNLEKWNVYGWSTLELSLGLLAGFGAFKLKRFSILLSNFLAVFSSAMLLTLIMSFSTTFGWGFTDWNQEPAWFWALNLGTVALVSLGLGLWSRNFGWRAIAPLSLSASAIVLVINSAGAFEDRWRIAVLSIALFAVLIFVRLSRNAKWIIEDNKDKAYLKDLQEREDNSLKRFGVAISILLASFSVIDVLQQFALEATKPLDGIATLTAAVVWLVGARINRSWVSAVVDKDATILMLRDTASAIGLTYLGLGVLSAIYPAQFTVGLAVAIALLLLVFILERFANVLLLPTLAVTIGAWVTATFGAIWYLFPGEFDKLEPLGYYMLALGLVFAAREYLSFNPRRVVPIYVLGLAGTVVAFSNFRTDIDPSSVGFALAFALSLIVVNVYPLLVTFLQERAKAEPFPNSKWIPVAQSVIVSLVAFPAFAQADTKIYLLSVGSGYLALALASMIVFKGKELANRFSEQAYLAIGFSVILAMFFTGFDALKIQSAFLLLDGFLILGYSLLAKNIRWAYVGYGLTSLSIVVTSYAWGTKTDSAIFACIAIVLGALVNLGLLWANLQFGENGNRTSWITRATTALSLALVITTAERFVPLQSSEYWILTIVPLAIVLAIELRKANSFAFIYAGAALLATSPVYVGQSELDLSLRLALVLGSLSFVLIRRSRADQQPGWIVGAQISAAALAYFISRIEMLQFEISWTGPEVLSITTAILLAVAAWLSRSELVSLGRFLRLDLPVLVATVPSIFFALVPNSVENAQENATRLLLASGIIWAHNVWRSTQRKQVPWLVASYISGLVLALASGWELYFSTELDWTGPEVYTLLIAAVFAANALFNRRLLAGAAAHLVLDLPVLVATVPSIIYALPNLSDEENILRLLIASAIVWAHNLIRTKQREQSAWLAASYVSGLALAFAVGREFYQVTKFDWDGPEVYSLIIAATLAVNAWLGRSLTGRLKSLLTLDLPVLIATLPSLVFALLPNTATPSENANRLLLATGLIWVHNVWRTHQRKQQGWLIAQGITGLIFAVALVQDVYVNAKLLWDGPELYSFAVLATVVVGLRLASEQKLLEGTLYRFGLPIAVAITPSVFYSWTSVTKQFGELDATEISRTLFVLAISIAAMLIGILKGNRGLNLVGTVELWLIGVPGLWFRTSSIDNGSADLELRGLIIAAVIYWAMSLLRKYTDLELKSIVFIGIPVTIALAPAIFHTLSTLGGTEIRNLDWWRFSIVLTVSLILLVVGSLREIGGTFFPGLIGVIVTVLPYGFHPLTN